jgi:two-component system repressor protein LuxO
LTHKYQALKRQLARIEGEPQLIGEGLPMQRVRQLIAKVAPTNSTVLILGETGTGKELVARAVHEQSLRAEMPFVAINCGALPENLIESELFGHRKGAFTGADEHRVGLFEVAHGGTLFLDEIGELDLDLQTKLLRFVQTGTLQRVGTTQLLKVDVRFVCATNRDPLQDVAEGRFREDLFYRLHVIPIHLPALRDRVDDILLLANHFLRKFAEEEHKAFRGLTPEVETLFMDYEWPGNIRQLQNVIRNVVVLYDAEQVRVEMLPPPLSGVANRGAAPQSAAAKSPRAAEPQGQAVRPLHVIEKEAIERAIELCDGNIPRAAALLEVSPSTIYRKRQAWQSISA